MNPPEKLLTADNPALRQRAKAMRKEMSEAEAKLWQHLRAGRLNGYKFRRQQPMGNYIVDFMCVTPKLIVEADGGQHTKQAAYDHARTAYLNSLGFTVLRFWNHEILQQTNDVLAEILRVLQELEKQPAQPVFLAEPLTPTATRPLSPWERARERATSRKACILGDQGIWERFPQFGECPLPSPPPRGRGRVAAGFAVSGGLKGSLGLQPLISGRLKNKKQPAQPIFLAEPLIPTATPSSLPWERARERATSRKACIWAVRVLGKIAAIREMPSPQPSPTGEGAGCSGFKRYRSSEKRMPEISTAGIFQIAFIARQMEQTPRAFFQTTFEPKW